MTLRADQLACERGERQLFSGVDFELRAGEALWLRGANGSGKTSLLRLLCGLSRPAHGEVRWRGRAVLGLREDYHRELLYLGHAVAIKDDLAAWENLATSVTLAGGRCNRAQACAALELAGLGELAGLPARALSQGQRRRVALARLGIAPLPPLLVLDEPYTALDQDAARALGAALERHLAQGGMLVYTTHQPVELRAARVHRLDLSATVAC